MCSSPYDATPRPAASTDRHMKDCAYDEETFAMLQVVRCFCQSFAAPNSQAWMHAFDMTRHPRFHWDGAQIVSDLQRVIQAVRVSRKSPFRFSNPFCEGCSQTVTAHERQLISCILQSRAGRMDRAEAHAFVLCEGNPAGPLLNAIDLLTRALALREVQP